MVANNTITRLERVFTREALTDLLWTRDFFAGCFHQFRWSGLSGVTLKPEELNVLGFVSISEHVDLNDPSQVQVSVYGFAIVGVRKSSEASSSLFFIPVVLESRDPGIQLPSPPSETEAAFQFANGPIIVLRIATKDFSFWKRIGKTIIEQAMPKKEFLLDMLDPGFTTGAKSVASTIQESVLDIKFLGGSDTTNVVLKFSIPEHPGLDFVLKFYPRVAFNTARFLNDLLAKARFRSFARLLASCDYQVSALQSMFRSAGDGTFFDEIERTTSSMNIPVNRFFPFMHIISFIPGVGDGGLPFWNSAIETPARENGVDQDILDLAAKLGKTIVGFHDALEEKSKQPALQDEQQRTAMIAAIKSQLSVARSFLADYASKIPENLAGTWSDLGEKLDFDAISKRAIPSFEEIRDTPRQYIHQDLHMGQLMYIDRLKEFLILDLEGDPQLPWRERIESYHVEKDLASLVRSLSYIKIAVIKTILEKKFTNIEEYILNFKVLFPLLFLFTSRTPGFLLPGIDPSIESEIQHLVKVLNDWEEQVRKTILSTYQQQREINLKLIEFYTLQRIMNEITYEIKFRPSNFFIPLIGLLELVS